MFTLGDLEISIVGRVVGASYAVLVAEELFALGCELLVSITSAGHESCRRTSLFQISLGAMVDHRKVSSFPPHTVWLEGMGSLGGS